MAYLVKQVNGEPRKMELVQIQEALKNGQIAQNWLVRDERQEHWYSVGKLVGTTVSQPVALNCPKCGATIPARHIDIGLPMNCPQCRTEVIVPDPLAVERRLRDRQFLVAARRNAIIGVVVLGVGLVVTILSFVVRDQSSGTWLVWHGPMVAGVAMCLWNVPRYFQLKRELKRPVKVGGGKS